MKKINWQLDPAHSEISFKVKHLMITNVSGDFKNFSAEVHSDNDSFENAEINFRADVNSINTNNEQRDGHLKSADFFDAEKYPAIVFRTTGTESFTPGEEREVEGELTIRDITRKEKLSVEFGGITKDPYGNTKAGFNISGKISRKNYGLTWNALTESGGVVVSDEIKLSAGIQLVKS